VIIITGWGSAIAAEFRRAIRQYDVFELARRAPFDDVPTTADRYLFCHGLLRPKRSWEQTIDEVAEGYRVNCTSITESCDRIIASNDHARICIIGSESAYRGSFDGVYAAAKADLHGYVEQVKLRTPGQQIVAISPGIVADAGMTTRREDVDNLERRRAEHPKRRFLRSRDVASMASFLLFEAEYVSNFVVRMHGGLQ
jgi:NAD(P)-dependent dehydrogenase (short-subunit alcohol dehydrogenase family)